MQHLLQLVAALTIWKAPRWLLPVLLGVWVWLNPSLTSGNPQRRWARLWGWCGCWRKGASRQQCTIRRAGTEPAEAPSWTPTPLKWQSFLPLHQTHLCRHLLHPLHLLSSSARAHLMTTSWLRSRLAQSWRRWGIKRTSGTVRVRLTCLFPTLISWTKSRGLVLPKLWVQGKRQLLL